MVALVDDKASFTSRVMIMRRSGRAMRYLMVAQDDLFQCKRQVLGLTKFTVHESQTQGIPSLWSFLLFCRQEQVR